FTGGETDERQFEFLVQEDTFNNIDVTQYSNFIKCFSEKSDFAPQVVLLYDMLNGAVSQEVIKGLHDDFMTSATKTMANFIAENGDMAFKYGMKIDTLTREDTEYVLGQGYED
ncbi:MAG TPA: hypothetical protein DCM40_10370, partial [Maribacter sp.]|nr:hypothetical protein [Maribacter sp.]